MILSPWRDPIPLTRAWCLWELYCTATTHAKFEIALSPTEVEDFQYALVNDFSSVNTMIAKVDSRNSEAFSPDDKQQIFEAITSSVGFDTINSIVFNEVLLSVQYIMYVYSDLTESVVAARLAGRMCSNRFKAEHRGRARLL